MPVSEHFGRTTEKGHALQEQIAVQATLNCLAGFGVLHMSIEQLALINAAIGAWLAIFLRGQTPLLKPQRPRRRISKRASRHQV